MSGDPPDPTPASGGGGRLVLVATPIGNLGDLSPRARQALVDADLIACEDTRRTGRLLALVGVERRPLLRLDDHTEAAESGRVLERLAAGATVALVSDAGLPAVADPGERLVAAAVAAGHRVEVVPGPSAGLTALVGSGLPTARFCFEGFLPRRASARAALLQELRDERRTMVFFEAPHRLAAALADLSAAFGADRRVAVARELTKLHEQWWRGTLGEAAARAAAAEPRGEHVVVVAGAPALAAPSDTEIDAALTELLAAGASVKEAAATVAARTGVARRVAYDAALRLRSPRPG
ncbi:MAG: 16S rRNA (cytidine(1402)-2'-O)-methyltransferase [Acidimicrobiia bacterium]